ncbi:MAG: MFS transporter [Planctomycetota bacterium]|nr:MFS transporter [Planctomycetota bacterium]
MANLIPRPLSALVGTQFLTVLNDNLLKQVILLWAVQTTATSYDLQAWAGLTFALPFLLFAGLAGDIADRFPKNHLIQLAKKAEVIVMTLALFAFWSQSLSAIFFVLFFMGVQSAFLGPAKYGALIEISPPVKLAKSNALMQASVLIAILLGTGLAGWAFSQGKHRLWQVGALGIGLALWGWLVAKKIPVLAPADGHRPIRYQPFQHAHRSIQLARSIPNLATSMFAHSIWWLVGGTIVFAWNEAGTQLFHISEGLWSAGLASFAVMIGCGCAFAGKQCKEEIPENLSSFAAVGMALFLFGAGWQHQNPWTLFIFLQGASFCSGVYLIPIRTHVQSLPPANRKGQLLGASQLLDFTFILFASVLKIILHAAGVDAVHTFFVLSGIMAFAAVLTRKPLTFFLDAKPK